jgi:hypothetical protein
MSLYEKEKLENIEIDFHSFSSFSVKILFITIPTCSVLIVMLVYVFQRSASYNPLNRVRRKRRSWYFWNEILQRARALHDDGGRGRKMLKC